MDNKALIEDLKKKAQEVKELADAWDAFFDLVEQTNLMANSKLVKNKKLQEILEFICREMLKKKTIKPKMVLNQLEGTDFYHGAILTMGMTGSFMYFKDLDLGMIALGSSGEETLMARFSIAAESESRGGIIPPLGKERYTLH